MSEGQITEEQKRAVAERAKGYREQRGEPVKIESGHEESLNSILYGTLIFTQLWQRCGSSAKAPLVV